MRREVLELGWLAVCGDLYQGGRIVVRVARVLCSYILFDDNKYYVFGSF